MFSTLKDNDCDIAVTEKKKSIMNLGNHLSISV